MHSVGGTFEVTTRSGVRVSPSTYVKSRWRRTCFLARSCVAD